MTRPYDFAALRRVNLERCALWHPGGVAHWDLSEWGVALAGEVGELCEAILAGRRGGARTPRGPCDPVAGELADVVLYLDLFMARAGFDHPFDGATLRRALALTDDHYIDADVLGLGVSASVGKMLDIVKKMNRSRDGVTGNRQAGAALRHDLGVHADRAMYRLMRLGEDYCGGFEMAVRSKFNAVSERNGFDVFMPDQDWPAAADGEAAQ